VMAGCFFVDLEFLECVADEEGYHCAGVAEDMKLVWMIAGGRWELREWW
jgi:hypothetical protein